MADAANTSPPGYCRFAIPKKGRLYDKCLTLLKGAGIEHRREARLDVAICKNLPITLVFLPASDIASYVGEGNVDIGITGFDVIEESGVSVDHIMDLGFGKCSLCVQAQSSKNITDVKTLAGKRIVTSFPNLTKKYFDPIDAEMGVTTKIKFVSGSVEAACGLGLADAVVDLVETGTTMRAAGLEITTKVLSTQSVLISNPHTEHKDIVDLLKSRIEGYITATKFVMVTYNVSVENLHEATKVTPGKRSPTVTGLDDIGFKSVSALIPKNEVNDIMDKLHDVGAFDILTVDISNSRM